MASPDHHCSQATLSTARVTVRSFRVADATRDRFDIRCPGALLPLPSEIAGKTPGPDFKNSGKEPRCCLTFDCGAPSSRYCGRHALRGDTSCTKAVAEPRKRPHFLVDSSRTRGSLNTQNHETRALSRVAGHEAASQLAGRTSGAAHMAKRNFIFDEGSVEAVERLRKQDEEFCRRLRIAVEMGDEFCPTTVITTPCTSRPILNYMRTD